MTVNNQPAVAPFTGSGQILGSDSRQTSVMAASWAGGNDAVQLSRLGGVLNVFARDASSSASRVERFQAAVRDRTYSVTGTALARRLMTEMLVNS